MSFSPEIYRKKLDLLQETQDSIVSISQWVLFHHRHAKDLCDIWSEYTLADKPEITPKKRLSLLYLCNDVVQQARHKRKPEFISGFALILPNVLNTVYPTLDAGVKPKVERLIGVWEQRGIFSGPEISLMRRGVDLLKTGQKVGDVKEPAPSAPAGPAVAKDLVTLNTLYSHFVKLLETCLSNLTQVGILLKQYLPNDHEELDNLPLPAVYISKLNVLEKLCNITAQNLADVTQSRHDLLAVLSNLQNVISAGLSADDTKAKSIARRLEKLKSTRLALQDMEEPSPAVDDDNDMVPTYENSDSDSDDERPSKVRRLSDSLTSSMGKKSVAFSEDIQIKEFEREEHPDSYEVEKSDDEAVQLFGAHHKDAVELMHERSHSSDDDGYDPTSLEDDQKSGLLSLLSKLS